MVTCVFWTTVLRLLRHVQSRTAPSPAARRSRTRYYEAYVRSEAGGGAHPAIRREEPGGGGTSDEDWGSGEYYSGEEFNEDDTMFTRDRLSHMDYHDAEADHDPEAPGGYYDDDQQPIFQAGCRSPKRRFLSSPHPSSRSTFSFECLRRQGSDEDPPPLSPSCTALPLHLMQQQVMAVAGFDTRRLRRLSPTQSLRSWATPPASPIGRDGSPSYTPLIQVDWRSPGSIGSIPGSLRRSSWYTDARDGPPSRAYSPSLLRLPTESHAHFMQKRGSANSLVEAVLISEGLGHYARDPKFVMAAKHEIADACAMTIDEMESAACHLLNGTMGNGGGGGSGAAVVGNGGTDSLSEARLMELSLRDYSDEEPEACRSEEDLTDEMICITTL